jgi:hypothetical protein
VAVALVSWLCLAAGCRAGAPTQGSESASRPGEGEAALRPGQGDEAPGPEDGGAASEPGEGGLPGTAAAPPPLPERLAAVVELPTHAFLHAAVRIPADPQGRLAFSACVLPGLDGECGATLDAALGADARAELAEHWRAVNRPPVPCQQLRRPAVPLRFRLAVPPIDGTLPEDCSDAAMMHNCDSDAALAWWFVRIYNSLPDS